MPYNANTAFTASGLKEVQPFFNYGIEIDMATGSGVLGYLLKLDDSTNCCINTSGALNAGDTNADAIIKIQVGSTDYYLAAWVAGSVSGEW